MAPRDRDAREAQLERVVRATAELGEADRDEVIKFAEELKRRRYGT